MVRFLLLLIILLPSLAWAKRINHEEYYQAIWCAEQGGQTEVVLWDMTRVDCLLPCYAIEFDFADKWAESIGQALHYAAMTDRQPGVVLIMEKESDTRYLRILQSVNAAHDLNIKIWTIKNSDKP